MKFIGTILMGTLLMLGAGVAGAVDMFLNRNKPKK